MSTTKPTPKWVKGTGIAGTVFIAGLAFWLSFTALTQLAKRAGIGEQQAWAWPLIVDGLIVVATVAVVVLRHKKGQYYAWFLLVLGALVSVTANAVEAAIPTEVLLAPSLAATVSAIPPLVLLASTHLAVVLAKNDDDSQPQPRSQKADTATPQVMATPTRTPLVLASITTETASKNPSPTTLNPVDPEPTEPQPEELTEEDLRRLLLGVGSEVTEPGSDRGELPRTYLVEEAKRLKDQGLTNRAIGEQLGVDPSTVGRWLRKQGDDNA